MAKNSSPEAIIENEILMYLHFHKVFSFKNVTGGYFDTKRKIFRKQVSPFAINGVSDIVGIYLGRPLFIEVKAPKGRLTPDQESFLARAKAAGAIAFVARSIDDVVAELKAATPCNTKS